VVDREDLSRDELVVFKLRLPVFDKLSYQYIVPRQEHETYLVKELPNLDSGNDASA
jgi:hypothetical protein